jgi:hypothetical protein
MQRLSGNLSASQFTEYTEFTAQANLVPHLGNLRRVRGLLLQCRMAAFERRAAMLR